MATDAKIKELIKRRASIKAKLTQFISFLSTAESCQQLSDIQLIDLESRINRMESSYSLYDDFQTELEMLSENPDELYAEREQFESMYSIQMATARALLTRHRTQPALNVSEVSSCNGCASATNRQNHIRLPKINLPRFSGEYQDWLEFKDLFISLIHNNKSLDDISKFHYLRNSLQGSAALNVRGSDFRADNYKNVFKLLCERYNCKQKLINNHVKALFSIAVLQKEPSEGIRRFIDNTNKHLQALKTLDEPVEHWDTLIVFIMASKLDSATQRGWEKHRNTLADSPSLETFLTFLRCRSNFLETLDDAKDFTISSVVKKDKHKSFIVSSNPSHTNKIKNKSYLCPLCSQGHYLYKCEAFRALPIDSRKMKAREFKVCLNCLRPGHTASVCRLGHCKYCKNMHNTLIHSHDTPQPQSTSIVENIALSTDNHSCHLLNHVLLSTALVQVMDAKGKPHRARVLLDNGSTANFITQDLSGKLHLPTSTVSSRVSGINNQTCESNRLCTIQIQSLNSDFKLNVDCLILPTLTTSVPHSYINKHELPLPSGIRLADPTFHVPGTVDILVGADVFWSVIDTNRIQLGKHKPVLFKTKFGWLISGALHKLGTHEVACMTIQNDKDISLTRFWELDTISPSHNYTPEERMCENIFTQTTRRNQDGRFVVTLPLKESPETLGNSYDAAKRRFLSLERKFDRDPLYKQRYIQFMQEYETLGHMSEFSGQIPSPHNYLPHHGVVRESSATTKLRVVFDASAITSSGKSLNDIQLVGATLQSDLLSILLRFRQHKYVVSADIEKFYRQILITDTQRPLQLVLWRSDSSHKLKTYTLNTVTYGTASASFLATRCLKQLATETICEKTQRVIANDFYVDDYLSGGDTISDTITVCHNVINRLNSAHFTLRKWQSNSARVLNSLTPNPTNHSRNSTDTVELSSNELSKTLGLNWHCTSDQLRYTINISHTNTKITKRVILSTVSQVFDPLGLVSPCIMEAKIIMQALWVNKCSWDEEVNGEIKAAWQAFIQTLCSINSLSIPRRITCDSPLSTEIHVFTDASEKAYGACLYVRSISVDGSICVRLLAAKSKVAPIKATTIPRLELCGALIGTRLCTKVLSSITFQPTKCVFWCDSMIVLGWLTSPSSMLKPFVRNRVAEILEGLGDDKTSTWRYVPSRDNPADLVSRGISANKIENMSLWWSGPSFLQLSASQWPSKPNSINSHTLPEIIHSYHIQDQSNLNKTNLFQTLINNSSNYSKLQRITAYIHRFIHNSKPSQAKKHGSLTSSELSLASNFLIKISQMDSFQQEYQILKSGKKLPVKNRILSLSPYLDSDIIRVGGRLDNSFYDYNTKHPIILDSKNHLTYLIMKACHLNLLHAGPQLMLATMRHQYWPLGGRNLARRIFRTCIRCARFKGETIQPIMGNLPKERLHLEYPFLETGTDYAGPIMIADRKGRGCRLIKSYICVFVCLATRAVHLELVSDMTKEAFIAALNRFIARRGKPKSIFSDNGSTFVGTFSELSHLLRLDYARDMADSGIQFSFIPAYTPHFGGLWESAVKSVKHHLKRILGLTHLTYEEMVTCLIQIEAILNSRPLTPLSDNPADLTPLTPSHFLIGRPLISLPHPQVTSQNITSLLRFQRIEYLKQHFWKRFSHEYIFWLQQKTKWNRSQGQLEEGALVLIKDSNTPPLQWLLGRVIRLLPGTDGVARVADIKTKKGVIRRAYNTICPLPIHFEDESSTPGACSR